MLIFHPDPHWTPVELTWRKIFPAPLGTKWNNSLYPRSSLEWGSSTVTAPLTPSTAGIRNQPWFALQHSQHIFILQRGCWAPAWCSGEREKLCHESQLQHLTQSERFQPEQGLFLSPSPASVNDYSCLMIHLMVDLFQQQMVVHASGWSTVFPLLKYSGCSSALRKGLANEAIREEKSCKKIKIPPKRKNVD